MRSRLCRVLTLLLAAPMAALGQAEGHDAAWTVVRDAPIGDGRDDWYRMSFVDAWNGWIVGGRIGPGVDDSYIGIKTSDAGRTWSDIHIPHFRARLIDGEPRVNERGHEERLAGARAYSVHLVNPGEAWVGGATRLAHTKDGGETWKTIHLDETLPDVPEFNAVAQQGRLNIYAVHFWDSKVGIISILAQLRGEDDFKGGMALATQDGGRTWTFRTASARGLRMTMASRAVGWMTSAVGRAGLYFTEDGWRSPRRLLEGQVYDAFLGADGRAWALGGPGPRLAPVTIRYSEDSGATWDSLDVDLGAEERAGATVIAFAPDRQGWVGGGGGLVLNTNGGLAWAPEQSPLRSSVEDMQYVDGVVYAVAQDGMVVRRGPAPPRPGPIDSLITTWGRLKSGRDRLEE